MQLQPGTESRLGMRSCGFGASRFLVSLSASLPSHVVLLGPLMWRRRRARPVALYLTDPPLPPEPSLFLFNERSAWWGFNRKPRLPSSTIPTQPGKLRRPAPTGRRTDHPYTPVIQCVCVSVCTSARVKDLTSRRINGCKGNQGWREVTRGADRKMKAGWLNYF